MLSKVVIFKMIEEVVKWGPTVIDASTKLYQATKARLEKRRLTSGEKPNYSLEELQEKMVLLELNDLEQSRLVSEMADKLQKMSQVHEVMLKQVRKAYIYSGVSVIICGILLLVSAFK